MAVTTDKWELVGSLFGYTAEPAACPRRPPFLQPGDQLFVNARSAFHCLLAGLQPGTVWLPTFLCPILPAVASSHSRVRYYTPPQLGACDSDQFSEVRSGDVVLLIDYFGLPYPRDSGALARSQGAVVVEDACQALLTESVGVNADFVLFSPRKFLGVPDGGILSARGKRPIPPVVWKTAPRDWWHQALGAATNRAAFDCGLGDRRWHEQFQRSEATAPIGPFRMSSLSQAALAAHFDYADIARRRRENYLCLLTELEDFALFSNLQEGIVPLGFPAQFENRDAVRRALFAEEIFPPVHWPVESVVPLEYEASHRLAATILTLPCDQRYGTATMERTAQVVKGVAQPCADT